MDRSNSSNSVISHEDCWDCQILFAKYSEGCILKNRYII